MEEENNVTENIEILPVVTTEDPEDVETDDDGYYIERGKVPPKLRSPNGKLGDPSKQQKAWDLYVKSWRNGNPNVYQAGLQAGYAPATAQNMNSFKWFKEKKDRLRRSTMMSNAEKNLSRILNLNYSKMKLLPDGSMKETVDPDVLRIVADISKTVVTTLGKDVGYSTKTEIGGGTKSEINIKSISYADPIEIEARVVEDEVKQIISGEEEVIKDIIENKDVGDNPSV